MIYLRGGNNHPANRGIFHIDCYDFFDTVVRDYILYDNFIVIAPDYRGAESTTSVQEKSNTSKLTESFGHNAKDITDDVAGDDVNDILDLDEVIDSIGEYIGVWGHRAKHPIYFYAESMGVLKLINAFRLLSENPRDPRGQLFRNNVRGIIMKAGVYDPMTMKTFRPNLWQHWHSAEPDSYGLSESDIARRNPFPTLQKNIISKIPTIIFHADNDPRAPVVDAEKYFDVICRMTAGTFGHLTGQNIAIVIYRDCQDDLAHSLADYTDDIYRQSLWFFAERMGKK